MSMSKGLNKEDRPRSKLVTVDLEHKNQDGFREYSHIERITGDSLDEDVIKKVRERFTRSADLIYIDSLHEYDHVKKNLEIIPGLYAAGNCAGGMYGDTYDATTTIGGTLAFAVNSGRVAGENAAKYLNAK